jgi:hypothetical protein
LAGVLLACSGDKVSIGGACSATSDCASGTFCLEKKCATEQCATDADCGASQSCTASFRCVSTSTLVPSVTTFAAKPDGSFAIGGNNLQAVTALQLSGGGITATQLSITPGGSDSAIVATASASLNLLVGTAYNLLVSSAAASTPVTVTFTLPSNVVTTPSGCSGGAVLTYDGVSAWNCAVPGAPPSITGARRALASPETPAAASSFRHCCTASPGR